MPTKRKKFIDKKNSVTFRLVHRSQKDPLAADETAPKHVLLDCGKRDSSDSKKKRKEEQQKYGIYYDDDYNYLQHLRDVNTVTDWEPILDRCQPGVDIVESDVLLESKDKPLLNLPSSVFQSHVEESEGLLNKATIVKGPKPDWDPDIVAALDDDFDFENSENELEDDFIALANPLEETSNGISDSDEANFDEDDEVSEHSFGSSEGKTRFTNYSMSSSVLPRSENLQDIDDHFEKFFEKYDDEEIGALDMDDIQGYLKPDSEIVQQLAKEFAESQDKSGLKDLVMSRHSQQASEITESSDEEFLDITIQEKTTEKWDCESIISTYSTTNNRPKLIEETKKNRIRISTKSGLPRDTLKTRGLTDHMLSILNKESTGICNAEEIASKITRAATVRPKNETSVEKKERKTAVKQIRKERRAEKKANKLAFKKEEENQEKLMLNLKNSLKGIKLL